MDWESGVHHTEVAFKVPISFSETVGKRGFHHGGKGGKKDVCSISVGKKN